MNSVIKALALISVLCLTSCNSKLGSSSQTIENVDLIEQLDELEPSSVVEAGNIPGDTDAEKLLYVLDAATGTKSAILIFVDSQIDTFEATGNRKEANELRKNRVLLSQAANETVDIYIRDVAKVYEDTFTPEEIKLYLDIFSRPELQKFSRAAVELQQKAIPIATAWGEDHVEPRYLELLSEQSGN